RQTEFHFLRDNANYLRAPSLPCLPLGSELPSLFWAIAATTRVTFDLFADGAWIKIQCSGDLGARLSFLEQAMDVYRSSWQRRR
ncbi:MAG: hypothetical protein ACI9DF_000046, partial [Verrucomicrobiales bacterium]